MSNKLFRLDCGYQNYDWGKLGSSSTVAQFASKSNSETKIDEAKPYAELWMGTHPSVPSYAVDSPELQGKSLRDLVTADPETMLHKSIIEKFGSDVELPFLFKVLSIRKVLSIQAHPDKALGAQLHAADPKNYPDANHKPEMAVAITDFEGFCGFKPLQEIAKTLETIKEFRDVIGEEISQEFISGIVADAKVGSPEDVNNRKLLQKVFGKLMNTDEKIIAERAKSLIESTKTNPELFTAIDKSLPQLMQDLNEQFPQDVGLFCGCLMLNHVTLKAGEAIFLQAKDPHAYIKGDIMECMAASDNVVRVGFTPKFKDVKNLVEMLTYAYGSVENQKMELLPFDKSSGDAKKSILYNPPIAEFAVLQTLFSKKAGQVQQFEAFEGPSIIICTTGSGKIQIKGSSEAYDFNTGYVYFVAPDVEITLTSVSEDEEFTTFRAFVESQ